MTRKNDSSSARPDPASRGFSIASHTSVRTRSHDVFLRTTAAPAKRPRFGSSMYFTANPTGSASPKRAPPAALTLGLDGLPRASDLVHGLPPVARYSFTSF